VKEKPVPLSERIAIGVATAVFIGTSAFIGSCDKDVNNSALDDVKQREQIETFITYHPDSPIYTEKNLSSLYESVKKNGFETVRFDIRWNLIEPEKGKIDSPHLMVYQDAVGEVTEKELEDPIIILSSAPDWAKEEYKTDKEAFFNSFQSYASQVKDAVSNLPGKQISHLQLFNELNNPLYNFIEISDLPRLVEIVKKAFLDYNPNLKVFTTVLASNILGIADNAGYGQNVMGYLSEFKTIKDSFDGIGIDYYPGTWQFKLDRFKDPANIAGDLLSGYAVLSPFTDPFSRIEAINGERKDILLDNFKDLAMLEKTFREVSSWGIEYYLAETGFPSNWPWLNEDYQELFYVTFFSRLDKLFRQFEEEGIPLPAKIGIYQIRDEAPGNIFGWFLRIATPTPMNSFGIEESDGDPKEVELNGTINKITKKF
jgi:hypothetical protein